MKASPARLWDNETALLGVSRMSYMKALARSVRLGMHEPHPADPRRSS
jgi:hypothetical protein